ncbi:MAG: chemotaxis protein [Herbaspirillum sp.]
MTKESNPGVPQLMTELKLLLFSISAHGNRHLDEIDADLTQTNFLLTEAIQELGTRFLAIHTLIRAQQDIMNELILSAPQHAKILARLHNVSDAVEMHVNTIVTQLQFQDMTNQLIGRALQQTTELREALDVLNSPISDIDSEVDAIECVQRVKKALDHKHQHIERRESKAVCQTRMESGDIELF